MNKFGTALLVSILLVPLAASAHPGRTDANGCHTDRKTGEYHCHGVTTPTPVARTQARTAARTIVGKDYNCADFASQREAQTLYAKSGGPAIDSYDLDRDRDGLACEDLSV